MQGVVKNCKFRGFKIILKNHFIEKYEAGEQFLPLTFFVYYFFEADSLHKSAQIFDIIWIRKPTFKVHF